MARKSWNVTYCMESLSWCRSKPDWSVKWVVDSRRHEQNYWELNLNLILLQRPCQYFCRNASFLKSFNQSYVKESIVNIIEIRNTFLYWVCYLCLLIGFNLNGLSFGLWDHIYTLSLSLNCSYLNVSLFLQVGPESTPLSQRIQACAQSAIFLIVLFP